MSGLMGDITTAGRGAINCGRGQGQASVCPFFFLRYRLQAHMLLDGKDASEGVIDFF